MTRKYTGGPDVFVVQVTVTYEQFRESLFAGWKECMPLAHIDAKAAWEHLVSGGDRYPDDDQGYFEDARVGWETGEWPKEDDDDDEEASIEAFAETIRHFDPADPYNSPPP